MKKVSKIFLKECFFISDLVFNNFLIINTPRQEYQWACPHYRYHCQPIVVAKSFTFLPFLAHCFFHPVQTMCNTSEDVQYKCGCAVKIISICKDVQYKQGRSSTFGTVEHYSKILSNE